MSYAKEKERIERKIKRAKRIALLVVALLVAVLCVFGYFFNAEGWKYKTGLPTLSKRCKGEMRVHFIDVGQGDCTLVEFPDGQVMLVDGGDASERSVSALLRYCNALAISTVDHLVITHADYDHYGGLFTFLDYKRVLNAYLPYNQEQINTRYAELYKKLTDKGADKRYTRRDIDISVQDCTVAFLYPSEDKTDDSSSVLWLDYAGVSVLLTGDMCEEEEDFCVREDKIGGFDAHGVDLRDTEIIKVAHHGASDATGKAFVEYIGVETAIVSCGAGNPYGHPTKKTLDTLAEAGASVYRTDKHGHICVTIRADGTYTTDFC